MLSESVDPTELERRVEQGDVQALLALFACHRERLKHIVRLRIDDRVRKRVDPSDVLQEAFLDVARRAADYLVAPTLPPFLWFRWIAGEKLLVQHRRHLGTRLRNASLDVSIHKGGLPHASSASLAAMLLGRLTSPTPRRVGPRCSARSRTRLTPWTHSTARLSRCGTSRSSATARPPKSWVCRSLPRASGILGRSSGLKDALGGLEGALDI